jgi:leucyl/phenylalanyl-tRNA--protein transferase
LEYALHEPNGLLAAGGDLTPERLLCAYRNGIFPWFNDCQPILWWSPDPRAVLFPKDLKISRSLRKCIRHDDFELSIDRDFPGVIRACAAPRRDTRETWITSEMRAAYLRLHALDHAHSVECWADDKLVGGLYGVALGRVFFGESMFTVMPDASKVALVHLCQQGFELIDCQLPSDHLARMGASSIPRQTFRSLLDRWCEGQESPLSLPRSEVPSR